MSSKTIIKSFWLCSWCLFFVQCRSSVVEEPNGRSESIATHSEKQFERTPEQALDAVRELLHSPELRSIKSGREISGLISLDKVSSLRASQRMAEFSKNFYAVEFKDNRGYAIVSRDLRTFPIYAILDSGRVDSKALNTPEMRLQAEKMLSGFRYEVEEYNKALGKKQGELRGNRGIPSQNTENSRQNFLNDGWRITREASPRLETTWGQDVLNRYIVMSSTGASYVDVHENPNYKNTKPYEQSIPSELIRSTIPRVFGCTPVAFGQVMYALRHEKGFKDLKYFSGEPVLWEKMDRYDSESSPECQRFLGWITSNCSPTILSGSTMVFNIKATEFLRKVIGDNIKSRYDNCIVAEGDFDGYGWAEDRRIAEEFFQYPKCFVIMTASAGALNYISYHSFVIDGMIEFKKRMKGSGFLGMGIFRRTHDGVRHLYHVNAGWDGASNGYYLYVQSVNDEFKYTGTNDAMDYRSKVAYLIVRPS